MSPPPSSPRAKERELHLLSKQRECDLELVKGEVEERDQLLARAKQAIESLQQELLATRREVEEATEVRGGEGRAVGRVKVRCRRSRCRGEG